MAMKKQFFYILLFFFPISLFAQTNSLPKKPLSFQEVGFNFGSLVTNLLQRESNLTELSRRNFMFTYKQHFLLQTYFRYGASFFYSKDNFNNNSSDDLKIFRLDLRIGFERKYEFDKKWSINRGIDLVTNYSSFNQDSSNDKTTFFQLGLAPFLGIQYNINDRVNITTETGINFFYVVNNLNTFFVSGSNDGTGVQINPFTPQEIILSVTF